jgi:hypothetical protein
MPFVNESWLDMEVEEQPAFHFVGRIREVKDVDC